MAGRWNDLVRVMNSPRVSKENRHNAKLLLNQMATAGGPDILRYEIENFFNKLQKCKSKN